MPASDRAGHGPLQGGSRRTVSHGGPGSQVGGQACCPAAHTPPPPQIPFYDQRAASVLGTSPEASIEIQIPEPGPQPQGVTSQKVHIHSCFLEDTTVGNSNRMMVHPGAADVKGVKKPREPRGDIGEPGAGWGAGRGPRARSLSFTRQS